MLLQDEMICRCGVWLTLTHNTICGQCCHITVDTRATKPYVVSGGHFTHNLYAVDARGLQIVDGYQKTVREGRNGIGRPLHTLTHTFLFNTIIINRLLVILCICASCMLQCFDETYHHEVDERIHFSLDNIPLCDRYG